MLGEGYSRATLRAAIGLPEKDVEQIIGLEKGFFQTADFVQLATPKQRTSLKATDMESGEVIEFPQRRNST